jgi:hypothetical protein
MNTLIRPATAMGTLFTLLLDSRSKTSEKRRTSPSTGSWVGALIRDPPALSGGQADARAASVQG